MRWFVNYLRSLFCQHEWELIGNLRLCGNDKSIPTGYEKTYRCKKCGYSKKYRL